MARPYDLIIFGASGFTGRLVCEQLLKHYPGNRIRWAMAGRSKDKLEKTKEKLRKYGFVAAETIPTLVADCSDKESLDEMTSTTNTIITTVGPYSLYGTPLIESCLRSETHYCDLTGEIPWVRKNVQSFHEEAERKSVKIVHCCGFDSVPFDLGVHMVFKDQEAAGRELAAVETLVGGVKGGVSGSTIASGFAVAELPAEELQAVSDPHCLDPAASTWKGPKMVDTFGMGFSRLAGKHTAPFIMATVNTRIVWRSHALLGHSYGERFAYKETMEASGRLSAFLSSLGLGFGAMFIAIRPIRNLVRRFLPKPGEGPSREAMLKGYWKLHVYAESVPKGGSGGGESVVHGLVAGQHDGGYYDTSRMLLECALAIATQGKELKEAGYREGGVLTPGSAVGVVGVERLRRAGFVFEMVPITE